MQVAISEPGPDIDGYQHEMKGDKTITSDRPTVPTIVLLINF